jgi:hypothetical protein
MTLWNLAWFIGLGVRGLTSFKRVRRKILLDYPKPTLRLRLPPLIDNGGYGETLLLEKAARIGARTRRNLAQLNSRMPLKGLSSLMSSYVVTWLILKFGIEIYGLGRSVLDRPRRIFVSQPRSLLYQVLRTVRSFTYKYILCTSPQQIYLGSLLRTTSLTTLISLVNTPRVHSLPGEPLLHYFHTSILTG